MIAKFLGKEEKQMIQDMAEEWMLSEIGLRDSTVSKWKYVSKRITLSDDKIDQLIELVMKFGTEEQQKQIKQIIMSAYKQFSDELKKLGILQ